VRPAPDDARDGTSPAAEAARDGRAPAAGAGADAPGERAPSASDGPAERAPSASDAAGGREPRPSGEPGSAAAATAHDPRGRSRRERLVEGVRAGVPFAIAGALLALSFGVVAQGAGLTPLAAIAMSAIVFAGSAQFTAIAILAQGGTVAAAVLAAALVNSRFLPMGVALGPSLPGGPLRRAAQGQAVVDASWAIAGRGDGTFDRWLLFGSTAVQYLGWVGGTVAGALGGNILGDPQTLGLDAIYPAFFLALLITELGDARARLVALIGGIVALALVPVAPAGVPVLAASLASLVGLHASARAEAAERGTG
jgi:4-azaleucine resistance transporter AzlC